MSLTRKIALVTLLLAWVNCSAAKTYQKPKIATRAEYRQCLEDADKMDLTLRDLTERRNALNHQLKLLQDETKAHVDTQAALDTYKAAAVDAFNEKMKAFDARGAELNKIGDKIEEDNEAYGAMVLASNKRCAGMMVSHADMRAVAKERAKKK